MTSSTSRRSSVISRLSRSFRRSPDTLFNPGSSRYNTSNSGGPEYDASRRPHLASVLSSYRRSLNRGNPSHRIRDFVASLLRSSSRGTSNLRNRLNRDHRQLLSLGAADTVASELAARGSTDTLDLLHGHLASVVDASRPSSMSDDTQALFRPNRSRFAPPSYTSLSVDTDLPPPYSPPRSVVADSAVTPSSGYGSDTPGAWPEEGNDRDSAIGGLDWTPSSTPTTSQRNRVYELPGTLRSDTPTSYRSVVSPISATSTRQSSFIPYHSSNDSSRNASPIAAVELDNTPISRPASPWTSPTISPASITSYSPRRRVQFNSPQNTTHTFQSTSPPSERIPQTNSATSSPSRSPISDYSALPATLTIGSTKPTFSSREGRLRNLARSINTTSRRAPSGSLLRSQAEFTRDPSRTTQALRLARVLDSAASISANNLSKVSYLSSMMKRQGSSAFGDLEDAIRRGSVSQFYRHAERVAGLGRELSDVDVEEVEEVIDCLTRFRDELVEYKRGRGRSSVTSGWTRDTVSSWMPSDASW